MNPATPVRQWWKTALASGALALLVLAVYHDIGSHEFIEFDDAFFVEAPHVREGLTLDGVKKSFTTQRGMWFPLTWLSHMADAHFYGDAPAGHHYTNLLLHAANAILLFLALCRLTGAMGPSLAAAALFAVHPLNTETVAYISCRKDLLSTFFWILAMGAYAGYARAPSAGRYLTVAGLMVLGMMAKPMLISLPVILLLLDYWPLRRFSRTAAAFLVKEKVPLLLVSLVFLGITVSVQRQTGAISSLAELSLSLRLENALVSYALYIGRMFRPVSLAVFYPFPRAISFWQWSGSAVLLVLITVIAWRARGRTPWVFTGWLWFLVSLVPVIGLVKVGQHAMADRYAYIPMIGLLVALVWSLSGHAETRRTGRVLWGALAVLAVAVLGMASYRQAGFWKNSITLFEHALRVTGDSDLVHNNLGKAYFERGDADAARAHIIEALRINPYLPQANYNMGMLFLKKGDADRALPWFSRAVEVDPGFPDARYSLANVFFNKGDFENALNHYTRILKDPEESPADLLAETH
ncbi:MAG: tetratricopeptide repeat protein, partial [Thermodesulfobacteriota bacterium]